MKVKKNINNNGINKNMSSKENNSETPSDKENLPAFIKVINDFVRDIGTTFPEYRMLLEKKASNVEYLYEFCKRKYPPRSSDIMERNIYIFDEDSDVDTEFLPSVHFKNLWQYEDLSEQSKEMIWRYLQLILLIIGVCHQEEETGEDRIDSMINNMAEFFASLPATATPAPSHASTSTPSESDPTGEQPRKTVPGDPEVPSLEEFDGMFGGKLASLAKEVAAESASLLNIEEGTTPDQAIKQLFSNPAKLTQMMTTISSKLDEQMKSGEFDQNEFMSDALGMMGKMGSMPGMSGLFSALSNVEKTPKYNQMSRLEKQKERIRNKLKNKNVK